jgi:hypothetical protein
MPGNRPKGHVMWDDHPQAKDYLIEHYGLRLAVDIARSLRQLYGIRATRDSVEGAARRFGITAHGRHGPCVADLAAELGVAAPALRNWLGRHGHEVRGSGKYRFVTHEVAEMLRAKYARPTYPHMTAEEAARRLGYTRSAIILMLRQGRLKGQKVGFAWVVCATAVSDKAIANRAAQRAYAERDPEIQRARTREIGREHMRRKRAKAKEVSHAG